MGIIMDVLKIGQFSESFYPIVDGVGRVSFNYAMKLAEKGHECYVVTPMADTGFRGKFPFEIIDYVSMTVPRTSQYRTGFAVFDKHYNDRIDMLSFDIIHAHTPFTAGNEALRLSKKHNCPLVGTFHSKYYDDFYKATGAELIAQLGVKYVVKFYEKCDQVWTVSKNSAQTLRDYGYDGEILIMENGTELFRPLPENEEHAREKYDLKTDAPILLYVGQLDWKKNIMLILKSLQILLEKNIPFRFIAAGQGTDRMEIEHKAYEMGLSANVCFTGHISDMNVLNGLYQCADILVFPSTYDTSSLVLREAAAMATPAVVVRGSAPAEVIEDGINGYISENLPESLAERIEDALGSRTAIDCVGQEARKTIPVAWDAVIENVISKYEGLINKTKGRSDKNRKKQ